VAAAMMDRRFIAQAYTAWHARDRAARSLRSGAETVHRGR
jgi:hypothetical protein